MSEHLFTILAVLFVKHFVVDFVFQTQHQIDRKGTYGDWIGFSHSIEHGLATFLVFMFFGIGLEASIILATTDTVVHYHIDYIKMRWGTKDMYTKLFWTQFGMDQMFHALTYIELVYLIS